MDHPVTMMLSLEATATSCASSLEPPSKVLTHKIEGSSWASADEASPLNMRSRDRPDRTANPSFFDVFPFLRDIFLQTLYWILCSVLLRNGIVRAKHLPRTLFHIWLSHYNVP